MSAFTQGNALRDSENQENVLSRLRASKGRLENQENVVPKPANRTVLGALENNPRKLQVQRGLKQVGCELQAGKLAERQLAN